MLGENPMTRIVLNFGNLGVIVIYVVLICQGHMLGQYSEGRFTHSPQAYFIYLLLFSQTWVEGFVCLFSFCHLKFYSLYPHPYSYRRQDNPGLKAWAHLRGGAWGHSSYNSWGPRTPWIMQELWPQETLQKYRAM